MAVATVRYCRLSAAGQSPIGPTVTLTPSNESRPERTRPTRNTGISFPIEPCHMYSKTLYAGWADMDFNSHMKNTAYLDKAADVRQMYLIEHGFPMEEFLRLRVGPVVMKDEIEYFKEIGLQQVITVTYALAGHSVDGSRFLLRHEIFRPDGKLSARVTSAGGWLHLDERRLIVPPAALLAAMRSLDTTSDFIELPSSVRTRS